MHNNPLFAGWTAPASGHLMGIGIPVSIFLFRVFVAASRKAYALIPEMQTHTHPPSSSNSHTPSVRFVCVQRPLLFMFFLALSY